MFRLIRGGSSSDGGGRKADEHGHGIGRKPSWVNERSTVSPILFAIYIAEVHAIYIAEVHEFVESRALGVQALSFVDDMTWLAVGEDVGYDR